MLTTDHDAISTLRGKHENNNLTASLVILQILIEDCNLRLEIHHTEVPAYLQGNESYLQPSCCHHR